MVFLKGADDVEVLEDEAGWVDREVRETFVESSDVPHSHHSRSCLQATIMTPMPRRRFLQGSSFALLSSHLTFAQDPKRAPIKAGQIGTKHAHAAGKLATMLELSDLYEVVGVAEVDEKRRAKVAQGKPYQGCTWVSEDALLSDPGIEVIAIETEIDELVPTALRCLRAGKHIHLDKPAGQTLAPCRALHAEAKKRGLTIQMGYMLRYNPAFEFLFKAVKAGWLGEITEVHGHMGKRASASLREELAAYPGGGLFELACHLIDALVTVLGKPVEVTSIALTSQDDGFKDNQIATFRYPNALATIGSNHNDPFGGPRRQFAVIGTEGSIEIRPLEPAKLRLSLTKAQGSFSKGIHEVDLPKSEGRYHGEFRDLAKVVRGEKAFAWGAAHDIAVQETLLRASGMPLD